MRGRNDNADNGCVAVDGSHINVRTKVVRRGCGFVIAGVKLEPRIDPNMAAGEADLDLRWDGDDIRGLGMDGGGTLNAVIARTQSIDIHSLRTKRLIDGLILVIAKVAVFDGGMNAAGGASISVGRTYNEGLTGARGRIKLPRADVIHTG